ncbi:MAG: PKD domain-containing protein, partial [Phycisphaerales bacterium]|nr:PKD domain-containing protein [Phycisphaerales bacterium]
VIAQTEESSPVALFTVTPEQPLLNQPFTVDASQSYDRPSAAAPISAYQWNWGDGSSDSTGVSVQHTYTKAGKFTITLTVSDTPPNATTPPNKSTAKKEVVIASPVIPPPPPTVGNRAPVASLVVAPAEGLVDDVFTFDASGTTDPDAGDTLSYRFVFGDGEQTAFTGSATATHRYATAGMYPVRLTVRDEFNASTDLTRSVRVVEQGEDRTPIALIAIGPRTGAAPLTLTFDGRLSYDPDGDPITYTWTFTLDGEVIDTLTDSMATRVFDEIGTYTVMLEVADAEGAVGFSDPETVFVTERGTPIEPPPPLPRPTPEPPPPSYLQRPPQLCGVGMLMFVFGSLLGLSTMRGVRRKRTRA